MIDNEERTIAIEWSTDDVLEVREDLTSDQAWHVLETNYFEHDANVGITWDTLTYWAEYLYPEEAAA